MSDFRFGVSLFEITSRERLIHACQEAERLGYDVISVPDHLGAPAPFPVLVAAAAVTRRPRVGTLVLNAGFWNPALLAREVATADLLTDGRLEVGLGAGHMKWEFERAGLPFEPPSIRLARLVALLDAIDALSQEELSHPHPYSTPQPLQKPRPPVLIGGTGDRLLDLAAARADILGFGGLMQRPGAAPGSFRLISAAETDERMRFFVRQAGERADGIMRNALIQRVIVTDDRRAAARRLAEEIPFHTPEELLDTPFVLIGTPEEIAGQLVAHRGRYGFTYFTVPQPSMAALGEVIGLLRSRGASAAG